jgi:glutaconate CoA-transferase subunit A
MVGWSLSSGTCRGWSCSRTEARFSLRMPDAMKAGRAPVRATKVRSLSEAVALVPDGARIAFGGQSVYQHPMAFVRELIRQRRRDLTVIGVLSGPELDMPAAAGCVRAAETSYVGLEQFGLARNLRRLIENGQVLIEDYSEITAFDRFRASEAGLTFLASPHLTGTDVIARNPRVRSFECPLTGKPYVAIPPADPDIAVLHVAAADQFGNVLSAHSKLLPQAFDETVARSCDTVIVTAEKLVDNDYVRRHADLTVIPGFRVAAVVEAPWGAHPCHSLGFYTLDRAHFEEYVEASRDDESFDAYLDRYVYGLKDEGEYLAILGIPRLMSLATATGVS